MTFYTFWCNKKPSASPRAFYCTKMCEKSKSTTFSYYKMLIMVPARVGGAIEEVASNSHHLVYRCIKQLQWGGLQCDCFAMLGKKHERLNPPRPPSSSALGMRPSGEGWSKLRGRTPASASTSTPALIVTLRMRMLKIQSTKRPSNQPTMQNNNKFCCTSVISVPSSWLEL